jgi:hypothetical protein
VSRGLWPGLLDLLAVDWWRAEMEYDMLSRGELPM